MKVALLTRYGTIGASSRVRATQFAGALESFGLVCIPFPLLSGRYLSARYSGRRVPLEVAKCYAKRLSDIRQARACDLIWIEKELLPFLPAQVELSLLRGRPYVVDLDDAIFHNYDRSNSALVRRWLGRKIDVLMKHARLVTVGNDYLRARAVDAGAPRVELIPSAVDLAFYPSETASSRIGLWGRALRVVWIGSPSTVKYLDLVSGPLQALASRFAVELKVIGAEAPTWAGVAAVSIPWSVDSEADDIAACDIGIMPLVDSPWERGKCGYKLIQYMACGLPVIASPVGANVEIVSEGSDGMLAANDEQWQSALLALAENAVLRREMGVRGRAKVEALYSVQAIAPRMARLLREAGS